MEKLFTRQSVLLRNTGMTFVREIMDRIDWEAPLISIRGPRGIGKTTMMLQYIKKTYGSGNTTVLYCSLDSVYFANKNILDLANSFYSNGGRHLFLDEVHKYPTWSQEIKEIYDTYPDMKVVISGSSLLNILTGDADLSRRCMPYEMQGLSFREFLKLYKKIDIPVWKLSDILNKPAALCDSVLDQCQPLPLFREYLKYGYYPFYLKNKSNYYQLIEQVISYVIETELPQIYNVEPALVRKIKALLDNVCNSIPFEVDATKLASVIGIHRTTVVNYLYMLDKAKVINMLFADTKSIKKLQKPDKIYTENPNILYALAGSDANIGTIRETFVVNQLTYNNTIEYGKEQGDFKIDGKYTLEVGGKKKDYSQIADLPDSYVLADDIETPFGHKIPLWAIGFTY